MTEGHVNLWDGASSVNQLVL